MVNDGMWYEKKYREWVRVTGSTVTVNLAWVMVLWLKENERMQENESGEPSWDLIAITVKGDQWKMATGTREEMAGLVDAITGLKPK